MSALAPVFRRDAFVVHRDAAVALPNGRMRYDALFNRAGNVQKYPQADGSVLREYRPQSEVFSSIALDTLNGAPGVLLHPDANLGTSFAEGSYPVRGAVGENASATADGLHTQGHLYVWDDEWNSLIASDEVVDLSMGYEVSPDFTPGTSPDGVHFDLIMRTITHDHAAGVPQGRAITARVLTDAKVLDHLPPSTRAAIQRRIDQRRDAAPLHFHLRGWPKGPAAIRPTTQENTMKIKFKFDGVDAVIEVADGANPQQIADAVAKLHADKAKTPKPKTDADAKAFDAAVAAQAKKLVRDAFGAPPGKKKGEEEEEEKDGKKADAFDVKLELAKFKADSDARTDALSSTKAVMGVDYSGAGKSVAQIQLDAIDELLGKEEVADIAGLPEAHRDGATAHAFARAMKAHQGRATHADGTLAEIQQTRVDAAKRAAAAPQQDKTLKAREDAIKRAALSRAERDEQSQKAS